MKTVALILAGCGSRDGSEIQEATLALYALSEAEINVKAFALPESQSEVVNHITGEVAEGEKRTQITESARIVRGDILPLDELVVNEFDGLVIPGGFGMAKNIFTFAYDGLDFTIDPCYSSIVEAFHKAGKPIAAMCISPLSLCPIIEGVHITLGEDGELSRNVEKRFGVKVTDAGREGVVVDAENKVVTTPCYMYGDSTIANIGRGAKAMVAALSEML